MYSICRRYAAPILCIFMLYSFDLCTPLYAEINGSLNKYRVSIHQLQRRFPYGIQCAAVVRKNGIMFQECSFTIPGQNWAKSDIHRAAQVVQLLLQEAMGKRRHVSEEDAYKLLSRYYPIAYDAHDYSRHVAEKMEGLMVELYFGKRIMSGEVYVNIGNAKYSHTPSNWASWAEGQK